MLSSSSALPFPNFWGRLPVEPDAAEYQYLTWSDCLSDLLNSVTNWGTRYPMVRLVVRLLELLPNSNDYQRQTTHTQTYFILKVILSQNAM